MMSKLILYVELIECRGDYGTIGTSETRSHKVLSDGYSLLYLLSLVNTG